MQVWLICRLHTGGRRLLICSCRAPRSTPVRRNFPLPRAINNTGQIAGYGDIETGDAHAVMWSQGTNPQTPEERIVSLEASLQDLVGSGRLKPGQATGLTRPLQNALRSLAKGQLASASAQLSDFQVEVARKVADGALTPEEAAALIDSATAIRTALGC